VKVSNGLNNYFNAMHQLAMNGNKEKHALPEAELSSAVFSLNNSLGETGEIISKDDAALLGNITGSNSFLNTKNKAAEVIHEIVTTSNPIVKAMDNMGCNPPPA
jgi:hypothetical protein